MGKWLKDPQVITFEIKDKVATITLNRPEKRNAMNATLRREILEALLSREGYAVRLAGNAQDGLELARTIPLDAAIVDDSRVYHGVTPVEPLDPTKPAHRDVFVVTFKKAG